MDENIRKLKEKGTPDRWRYAVALEKMGKPAVEYLTHALTDEDKWVRYVAADALGNIGDQCCVDSLIVALKDIDQDVRFAAAEALGKLGDVRALNALNETCKGDNCYVKIAAEDAITTISKQK